MKTNTILSSIIVLLLGVIVFLLVTPRKPEIQPIPGVSVASGTYVFKVKEKDKTYANTIDIENKEDIYYYKSTEKKEGEKDVISQAKMNKDFETLEWKIVNTKKNINVIAVRKGNKLIVEGTFDNKKNNKKEVQIDERKWLQVYQLGLMKYAVNGTKEKSAEFWVLNPDEPGNAMVLAGTRQTSETTEVSGKQVKAVKIRIDLAGLLSSFWTGDYWYRISDGFFVKAKFTGDFLLELKEEKKK